MEEKIVVDFGGNKKWILKIQEFNSEIDLDNITKIDYTNIYAELITISTLLNKVGFLKAEADHGYAYEKLSCEIYQAKMSEHYRKKLKTVSGDKVKWPTIAQVENAVLIDEAVQLKKKKVLRLKREAEQIDSLYWSVKDKSGKLNKISENMKLTPEDFERELVESSINGILIKGIKKKYGRHLLEK